MSSQEGHDIEKVPTMPAESSSDFQRGSEKDQTGEPVSVESAQPPMTLAREILFVIVVCSSNVFTQAGLGMTVAPLKIIGSGLGVSNPGRT